MQTDEQLMDQFQKGRREAFDELFERYRSPVYGFFRRRLNIQARAEDLTQETFLVILRGHERYEPLARFRTYLYAIALKMLWTERRKQLRESRQSGNADEIPQRSEPESTFWVRSALAQLQVDHREVLMLREYEQLSYDDIAELLKIPVNTVRSRLFRARSEMKTLLQSQDVREASR
jgi:RNA polymerase sigma-70 factor (ECF subfamily)